VNHFLLFKRDRSIQQIHLPDAHFQQFTFAKSERIGHGNERAQPKLMAGVLVRDTSSKIVC